MKDLFEHYETLPQEVQEVLAKHGECESYDNCKALIVDLELIGYTCDYGLDACPYELRKMRNLDTYKAFIGWKNSDNVIRTDKNEWRTQCSQYTLPMTKKELYKYFKKEFGYK